HRLRAAARGAGRAGGGRPARARHPQDRGSCGMANALVAPLAPSLGAWALRLLARTLRIRREERAVEPLWASNTPAIYVVWHARLLLLPYLYGRSGARVLISRSRDGEMVARLVRRFGFVVVRGSSSRGGGGGPPRVGGGRGGGAR